MHGIISGCRTCLPIIGGIIGTIAFIYLFYWLAQKHKKVFWSVIITSIVVSFFTIMTQRVVFPRITRVFTLMCGGREQVTEEWIVYDTDPRNDTFIKGRLTYRFLKRLDYILMKEKANEGMRLDSAILNELAQYDPKLIDAYDRWRKCKDMRRSYHRTIYPDERQLYHYLRE